MLYILGSGFSKSAGCPTLKTSLQQIFGTCDNNNIEQVYQWLQNHLFSHTDNWISSSNIEEIFSRLDLFIHYNILPPTVMKESIFIRQWLLKTFLQFLNSSHVNINEHYLKFLDTIKQNDVFISFNYDLILETALKQLNKSYYYPLIEQQHENELTILKLHGSINFWECTTCSSFIKAGSHPSCPFNVNHITQPLIIPPSLYKQYSNKLIRRLWRIALKEIINCESICIIGYSLSPADSLAIQLLDFGLNLGKNKTIRLINGSHYHDHILDEMVSNHRLYNTELTFEQFVDYLQ